METWLSWGLVLAIAGAAYLYYSQKGNRAQTRGRSTVPKPPVQWTDTETKSKPAAKNNKGKKASKADKPAKSVKNAVQEVSKNVEAYLSTASTAGADADDDLTPATSPSLPATQNPSGKNVSDMLEPQAARQILKIGASEKPARPAKQQQQKSETQEKTKKQRQNEKKKEEAKAAREAAEEERKKLAEKQRRIAREARGEPARNGLQSAQAPTSNPWSKPATQAAPAQAAPVNGQLLDTIDNVSTTSSSEAATNGTAPTPDSTSYSNIPSEEDQLRMALEDSAWTTVPKGKKNKKAKAIDEGSDSGSAEPAPAPVQAVKPAPVKKQENAKPASRFEILSPPATEVGHPMDSDWPVVHRYTVGLQRDGHLEEASRWLSDVLGQSKGRFLDWHVNKALACVKDTQQRSRQSRAHDILKHPGLEQPAIVTNASSANVNIHSVKRAPAGVAMPMWSATSFSVLT
ncbi:hypothetical protein K458DRAFT_382730 [Lentithecium fluviatile CBS 122367]|uniref:Uncharacterized protein n=1 Tax=Lentithecium fluviatile CBS 122367 TaxID=1168545 RepID=A0A6G1JM04_9PLEO|nr:hypothetical protein K458DRAFT_382730 [Lentithecium fluviatile CBS 122367]